MFFGFFLFFILMILVLGVWWVGKKGNKRGSFSKDEKISLGYLFLWDGTVDRGPYLAVGLIGFALKYNMDRLIAYFGFGKAWSVFNYFAPQPGGLGRLYSGLDTQMFLVFLTAALPFIWVGVVLTLRRLRSAGLPLPLVALFFAPVVNLLFFLLLAAIPAQENHEEKAGKPGGALGSWLDRWIPQSLLGSAIAAALVASLLGGAVVWVTIGFFKTYGWTVFVAVPFGMGLFAALLHGYHQPRSLFQSLGVAAFSAILLGVLLLAAAFEGIFCLFMAMPLGLVLAMIGGVIGYVIQRRPGPRPSTAFLAVLLFFPLIMGMETASPLEAPVFEVITSVDIQAPPERVWKNVVAFTEIPPPQELLFRIGLAYPIRAQIQGKGPGAVRHCVFSTGPFVEPIQVWDEPRLLKFSVTENPAPMEEWTPYHDIHPPHLHNFLVSNGGQFRLIPLPGGGTRLEGTTWYLHHMWPAAYWQLWSDAIIHKIHLRVLNHIKKETEGKS